MPSRVPLFAGIIVVLSAPTWAGPLLGPPTLVPVPHYPDPITAADLNADGKMDLVVGTREVDSVCVLIGNGDGTFQTARCYETGGANRGAAVGDVTGDGKLDLVTPNYGSHTISILRGVGNGTFTTHTDIAAGRYPECTQIADFDGDGDADILSTASTTHTLSTFLGNGGGVFTPGLVYGTGLNPTILRHADLNHDNRPDFVLTNASGQAMTTYFNAGFGEFNLRFDYVVDSPTGVACGDFTGDTFADVVTCCSVARNLTILVNTGSIFFNSVLSVPMLATNNSVEVADVNGDTKPDLISVSPDVDSVAVALGDGAGGFQDAQTFVAAPPDAAPRFLAIADFNNDGHPDVACTAGGASAIAILLNTSAVTAVSPHATPLRPVLELRAPAPNPMSGGSLVRFSIAAKSAVTAEVFDLQGRVIRSLASKAVYEAGEHSLQWNGRDDFGHVAKSGVYAIRVSDGRHSAMQKVTLTR